MNLMSILFFAGLVFLVLFFITLIIRVMVVRHRGLRLIRKGILPRETSSEDSPFLPSGRATMSESEVGMLSLLFGIAVLHQGLTEGVWGIVRALIGFAIILYLGPAVVSWFWSAADSEDGLAKMCHRLLNWSVACLTFPLLALL